MTDEIQESVKTDETEEQRKARIQSCIADVNAALEKHSCVMDAYMILRPGKGPEAAINIISK